LEGRSAAVSIADGRGTALRSLLSRRYAVVSAIWLVWAGAVLATVAVGMAAGVYNHATEVPGSPFFPLYSWDYGWYWTIAHHGYDHISDRYAFFPLWSWLIRWSGSIPDWQFAGALTLLGSALTFLGVAAGSPAGRPRQAALALACWPGSFALLLPYPDGLALAAAAWAGVFFMRGWPLAAAPLGFAAALLRPNGFVIALPLLILSWRRGLLYKFSALVPVAGVVLVELFFWKRSGDAGAFFHAQEFWGRRGPGGVGHWAGDAWRVFADHAVFLVPLALVAAVVFVLAWRRFGWLPTLAVAYVCALPVLLAATTSLHSLVDSARCALVLPLLVVLWRLGPRYRPWAAFATAVVALLLASGLMKSFGRQSLFAFPIFWAIADGPAWLRRRELAVVGFAANLGLALLLTRFAP
jgi:hypothetical protein